MNFHAPDALTTDRKPRCREITGSDIDAIADLLTRGFAGRSRDYWMRGLRRQSTRQVPQGYPRYGFCLEHEGTPVGVLLLLFALTAFRNETAIRCNVASWYVDPRFRGHAPRLVWAGLKNRNVTYFNVTPAISTWSIVEALGFRRYCNGLHISLPVLSRAEPAMRIELVDGGGTTMPNEATNAGLTDAECVLLADHAAYGCLSLVCHPANDAPMPFVLTPFGIKHGRIPLPAMQLIYCRDVADFVRCAGAIGKLLLRRGKPMVIVDANVPIAGLPGFYTEARGRKYFRGPNPPHLADLAETELAVYGP